VQTTEANARQLVSRARRHIADGRRASVRSADRQRLLDAFRDAAHDGDLDALESVVRPPLSPR
jgi:RNA polymerase sigma-70 factor (ECF subfamily)